MCGICFYISDSPIKGQDKDRLEKMFMKIKHRGPDDTRIRYYNDNAVACFHRLAITDPTSAGMQPFEDDRYVCMINGEIYNYKTLWRELGPEYQHQSHSDCEVVLPIFKQIVGDRNPEVDDITKLCEVLDGEFAFIIYDIKTHNIYWGVDELRVRPLFYCFLNDDVYFASEQKAFPSGGEVYAVPAGYVGRFVPGPLGHISQRSYYNFDEIARLPPQMYLDITEEAAAKRLRELLIANVDAKLHPEREFAFLLSGGLDSSLVCGIAAKLLSPTRIRTFTVGFSRDAPDVVAARKVAKHIDSIHTEFIFTYEEGIAILPEIVRVNESWDQTTTRASTPMSLCVRAVKNKHPNIAVIYSGEVADELLMGYIEWQNAPSPEAARNHVIKRLRDITYFDGLRADRTVAGVGCELRLPFFGKKLLDFVLHLPPQYLMPQYHNGIEKWLLRRAFDGLDYIPHEILWRTKNAMSDATSVLGERGSGWKESIKEYAAEQIHVSRFKSCKYDHVQTIEDFMYREWFDRYGYESSTIPYKWLQNWGPEGITDSSATALPNYKQ